MKKERISLQYFLKSGENVIVSYSAHQSYTLIAGLFFYTIGLQEMRLLRQLFFLSGDRKRAISKP